MSRFHAFWYGVWGAALLPAGLRPAAAVAAAGALLALGFGPHRGRSAAALVGILALGAGAWARQAMDADRPVWRIPPGEGAWSARVVGAAEPRGEGWEWVCDLGPSSGPTQGVLPVRAAVRLTRGSFPGAAPGALLRIQGEADSLEGPRNPGGIDTRALYLGRGIRARVRVRDAAGIRVCRPAPWLSMRLEALRAGIRAALARHLTPPARAFASSVLLGETAALGEEDRDGLVALGVIHIVIIAGLHLHLIHAGARAALRGLGASGALELALPLGVVLAYAWLTHGHLPAQRVAWSLALAELARARGLPHSAGIGAATAAALLLFQEPERARDASYILSTAATWGIHELGPGLSLRAGDNPIRGLFRASLLTQIAVWPLLPWTIGRGSAVGLGANFLAVPLAAALIVTGTGALLAEGTLGGTAVPLWAAVEFLGNALHRLAGLGAAWPAAARVLTGTPAAWILLALAALAALAHGPRRLRAGAWTVYGLVAALIYCGAALRPAGAPCLRVAFLDVGQGDATLVTFPDGASVLVDAGAKRPDWDAGVRVVEPALGALGIRSLEWIVATHSDNDHSGGVPTLVRDGLTRAVCLPPDSAGGNWTAVLSALRGSGVVRERVAAGWTWVSADRSDTVRCLHPDSTALRAGLRENDLCLVLEFSTPQGRFLDTGDIEHAGEGRLCDRGALRPIALLKVAHHGSRTSSGPGFLAPLGRPVAVISVGARNPFGHPSPEVVARLEDFCSDVRQTRHEGALFYELRPGGAVRVGADAWSRDFERGGASPPKP